MKKLLCFFVIALSLCVYPIMLRVPVEISHVFGLVEADSFSWYRMWLIVIVGWTFYLNPKMDKSWLAISYLALVVASTLSSKYIRTAAFGSPWVHEGFLVIVGYLGLYVASKRYGLFKGLETCLDIVVVIAFIASLFQLRNFPIYSVFGNPNNLGLFCALFFPCLLVRKKYLLATMILFMALGSETRGSWLAILITSFVLGRQQMGYALIASLLLVIPFHKKIVPRVTSTLHELHYPSQDRDLGGRIHMWKNSIPQLKKTILIGNGPGNYGMYFPQHQYFGKLVVDRPHNMYFNVWIATGLVSLLILLLGIWNIIFLSSNPSLEMGVIGFLIAGMFTDSVLSVTPYFIIFLGCLSYKKPLTINLEAR